MEHALHLAAKHFVEEVAPTPASALHKKAAEDSDDEDENVEFDVADTVGKALALVTQVSSPFCHCIILTPFLRYGSLPRLASSFISAAMR